MASGDTDLRLVFWNTWLLRPRLWPGGPALPGGERFFAPDVTRRAPLVGAALAGRFDVAAMAECFEQPEQDAVRAAWPDGAMAAAGPGRGRFRFTGSGLLTVVDPTTPARAEVVGSVRHAYRAGGDVRDSDTFATKGALLVRVRVGGTSGPVVDVVSTHLIAGGDLLPVPGANDAARHHRARMAQVDELVAFVNQARDPANPLVLVGDLNVAAHDPDPSLTDPTERHRDLLARLEPLGLVDQWVASGVGAGHTCNFDDPAQLPPDPHEPDAVSDGRLRAGDAPDPLGLPGERIDYVCLAPARTGSTEVAAGRPRRWAFPGRDATGGPAGSLSDHLALSVTLTLSRHAE